MCFALLVFFHFPDISFVTQSLTTESNNSLEEKRAPLRQVFAFSPQSDNCCSASKMDLCINSDKTCPICGEQAKPGNKLYTHYGAICCMGCKAFFRRIHQNQVSKEKLICKLNDNCSITPIRRLKCMKCRYQKCLKVK